MRRVALSLSLLSLSLAWAACSNAPPPDPNPLPPPTGSPSASVAPTAEPEVDESWRKSPPGPDGDVTFVPPKIEEAKLANGLRVLVVTRKELPIVAVHLAVPRGADQDKPGLGAFAATLLVQGTKGHDALAFNDAVKDLGASLSAWANYDSVTVAGRCLSKKLPKLLDLLGETVTAPLFDKAEIERERTSRLTSLAQQRDQPNTILWNTTIETLYPGTHAYGAPLIGSEDAVKKYAEADFKRFFREQVGPEGAVLAFAGDVTLDEAKAEAERVLGKWKAKTKKRTAIAVPPAPKGKAPRVVLYERPKATQSQVYLALVGVPRKTPDFEAVLLLNTILGGQFTSRLNMNLREKHAYTYGARSGFEFRLGPGPFTAGGAIESKHTIAAIGEILEEIAKIRKAPVTDEELAVAKHYLVKSMPARFETAWETAATLAGLGIYDLPLDEFAKRPAKIEAVTAADIQKAAEKHLAEASRIIVVVGDPSHAEGLSKLGLGPMVVKKPPEPKEKDGEKPKGK